MASLERYILTGTKLALKNPKLRKKDLLEWSTGELDPQPGEVTVYIPDPGVWVSVPASCDKRKGADA